MNRKISVSNLLSKSFLYLFMLFLIVIMMAPFAWMISTSFKRPEDVYKFPPVWIPEKPTLTNYPTVFNDVPFLRFFFNSLLVASTVTIGCVFTSSLAGFAFAKYDFFARDKFFIIVLSTMMIPFQVTLIPFYIMMRRFRLIDTYWALIIPGLNSAFGIFLMRQFIMNIPNELLDAARIDGCSEFRIYWRIILPLSKAALGTLSIFIFMWSWDSFLWPIIVINRLEMKTIPLGLMMFDQFYGGPRQHLIMAGTTMAVLPVLLVFLFVQKQFVKGITLTGLKG